MSVYANNFLLEGPENPYLMFLSRHYTLRTLGAPGSVHNSHKPWTADWQAHGKRVADSPLKLCNCEAYFVPLLKPPWDWFLVSSGANLLGNTSLLSFPFSLSSFPHFPIGTCWDNLSNLLFSQLLLSFQFCGILNEDLFLRFSICWGYLNVILLLLSSYIEKVEIFVTGDRATKSLTLPTCSACY